MNQNLENNSSVFKLRQRLIHLQLILAILISYSISLAAFYDQRPEILNVPPKDNTKTTVDISSWHKASYGHFAILAQVITFFPDADYYFLARDIEYMYDIAQVIFKNDPVMRKRFHLVPISTNLSNHQTEMVEYLEQEGLTKHSLGKRPAVFVDSCCSGSVPQKIITAFDKKKLDIKGFLIQTEYFPNSNLGKTLGSDGEEIESLPHYTDSAVEYVNKNGKIRIRAEYADSGERTQVRKIMEQIRFDYDNAASRQKIARLVTQMRIVYSYVLKKSPYPKATKADAIEALKVLSAEFNIPAIEFIEDCQNMSRKGYESISSERVQSLLDPKGMVAVNNNEALALRIAKNPDQIETLAENLNLEAAIKRATSILLSSSSEELGVTKVQYKVLVKNWLEGIRNGSIEIDDSDLRLEVLLKLNSKFQDPAEAAKDLLEYFNSYGEIEEHSKIEKIVKKFMIDALMREKYKYYRTSFLGTILLEGTVFQNNMSLLKAIISNFVENADAKSTSILAEDLVKIESNYMNSNWGYQDEKAAKFLKIIKMTLDTLPTFSRSFTETFLNSDLLQAQPLPKRTSDLMNWIFSQRDFFDADALTLTVNSTLAAKLMPGKAKQPKTNSVDDLISYFANDDQGKGNSCQVILTK